jgi:hypothetical protein
MGQDWKEGMITALMSFQGWLCWLWCQIYFAGKIVRLPLICLVCEESWAGSIKLGSRSFGK